MKQKPSAYLSILIYKCNCTGRRSADYIFWHFQRQECWWNFIFINWTNSQWRPSSVRTGWMVWRSYFTSPIVHANSMHSKPGVCCRCRVWEPSGCWRALWKASSIPPNLKRLLLPCLAVGMFVKPMFGIIIAVMLKTASSGNYNFELLCPTILTVCYFFILLLACASFLSIIGVALDILLAISLHLRYQELVTTNRINISLVAIWMISVVAAFVFIYNSLPKELNKLVSVSNCWLF